MASIQPVNPYLLAALLFALFLLKGNSISDHSHNHNHELKTLDFTLYQQDIWNTTGYVTVDGVPGTSPYSQLTFPFGTIYTLHENMTVTSNSTSNAAGSVEGVLITTGFDGIHFMAIYKFNLQLKHHAGSISILGVFHAANPSDIPVVGGTGDFKCVQGYVTISLVRVKGLSYTYKMDFHLHWPPYAYGYSA